MAIALKSYVHVNLGSGIMTQKECWANAVISAEFTTQSISKDFHLIKDGVECGKMQAVFKISKNKFAVNIRSFQEYFKKKEHLKICYEGPQEKTNDPNEDKEDKINAGFVCP